MQFGIFDHLDRGEADLASFYEARLSLIETYDRLGFRSYHLAEHHATPLGMAPSPGLFLSSVAQRTERLRFGPMVYCLPLYHPLRLLEEICMLDQLGRGRLELGVGRGISPIELSYFGIEAEEAPALYREALDLILAGLAAEERLTFAGTHWRIDDMPVPLRPVQRPHPPLWYGLGHPSAVGWPAENGVNIVSNAPPPRVREVTDAYRAAWAAAGRDEGDLPLLGTTRHIVVADSDREAVDLGRRAYPVWRESFFRLWREHGREPVGVSYPEDFDGLLEAGVAIAGTPATVRDGIAAQVAACGVNFMLCRFAFGDLSVEEASRSARLFADQVAGALPAAA